MFLACIAIKNISIASVQIETAPPWHCIVPTAAAGGFCVILKCSVTQFIEANAFLLICFPPFASFRRVFLRRKRTTDAGQLRSFNLATSSSCFRPTEYGVSATGT